MNNTPQPDPEADWWTTTDVARYLGIQLGTVSTYVTRSQMPQPDRLYGRTRVWDPARVIEWHNSRPRAGKGKQ